MRRDPSAGSALEGADEPGRHCAAYLSRGQCPYATKG